MPEEKVEKLKGEERVDALVLFLAKHGIHVPEELQPEEKQEEQPEEVK